MNDEDISELAEFFDLLAKFDYEDKNEERGGLKEGEVETIDKDGNKIKVLL